MGRLAKLSKAYSGTGVQFLGVVVDVMSEQGKTNTEAAQLASSAGANYPILVSTEALTRYVSYIPSTHIYDSNGKMIAKYVGGNSQSDWINIIETLVAKY